MTPEEQGCAVWRWGWGKEGKMCKRLSESERVNGMGGKEGLPVSNLEDT